MPDQSLPEKALARAVMCLLDFGQGIVVNVDNEMVIVHKALDGSLKMNKAVQITKDMNQHWHGNVINVEGEKPTIH